MPDENRRFRYSAAFQLDYSCQRATEALPYENYQPFGRITEHTQHSCAIGSAVSINLTHPQVVSAKSLNHFAPPSRGWSFSNNL